MVNARAGIRLGQFHHKELIARLQDVADGGRLSELKRAGAAMVFRSAGQARRAASVSPRAVELRAGLDRETSLRRQSGRKWLRSPARKSGGLRRPASAARRSWPCRSSAASAGAGDKLHINATTGLRLDHGRLVPFSRKRLMSGIRHGAPWKGPAAETSPFEDPFSGECARPR